MPVDERVLTIPAAHFRAVGSFQGFRRADDAYRQAILDSAVFTFQPRSTVETDVNFKQLVPYVVLRCGERLFHYRRGSAGTETRLRARRSIGIGGHISEDDAAGGSPYATGMSRELHEEVDIRTASRERLIGFLNDDSVYVGQFHLGVVHLIDLAAPAVTPREAVLADAGFASLTELLKDREEFETWSRFVFDVLPGFPEERAS